MNINWKVRLKSKTFWAAIISVLVNVVFRILDLCGVEVPVTADQIMQVAAIVLSFLAAIGIVVDPTTAGIGDSAQALMYDSPKEDVATEDQAGE